MSTFLHTPSLLASSLPPQTAGAVLEAEDDNDEGTEAAAVAAPSSKLGAVCDRILSILRGGVEDKVVVFAKWGYSLELLAACLDERHVPSLYILGARHRHHAQARPGSRGLPQTPRQQQQGGSGRHHHSAGCVALLSPLGPDARAVPEARALAAFNGDLKQAEDEEEDEERAPVVSVGKLAAVRVLLLRFDEVGKDFVTGFD